MFSPAWPRSRSPYKWRPGSNVLQRNSVRLAEVWLDEFKQIYYDRINNKLGNFGDVTQRRELRDSLQCKRLECVKRIILREVGILQFLLVLGECLS